MSRTLSDIDDLKRKKRELPLKIHRNKVDIAELQRTNSALQRDLETGDGEISKLEQEKMLLSIPMILFGIGLMIWASRRALSAPTALYDV